MTTWPFNPYPWHTDPRAFTVKPGWVFFFSEELDLTAGGRLGDGPAEVTEGYGGWERIDRPRRTSLTEFQGSTGRTITIPVLFDGILSLPSPSDSRTTIDSAPSVESDIRAMERLATRPPHMREPPAVIVNAAGLVPYDYSTFMNLRWLIQDISWDDALTIRRRDGDRIRAGATVTIWQQETADTLPTNPHRTATGKVHFIPVHKGDTLKRIATKHHTTVAKLKKLNGIRDSKHWLATHNRIRVS